MLCLCRHRATSLPHDRPPVKPCEPLIPFTLFRACHLGKLRALQRLRERIAEIYIHEMLGEVKQEFTRMQKKFAVKRLDDEIRKLRYDVPVDM